MCCSSLEWNIDSLRSTFRRAIDHLQSGGCSFSLCSNSSASNLVSVGKTLVLTLNFFSDFQHSRKRVIPCAPCLVTGPLLRYAHRNHFASNSLPVVGAFHPRSVEPAPRGSMLWRQRLKLRPSCDRRTRLLLLMLLLLVFAR